MDPDVIKLVIAVLGFLGAAIGLAAALINRKREVIQRQEVIHRTEATNSVSKGQSRLECPRCGATALRQTTGFRGGWYIAGTLYGVLTLLFALFLVGVSLDAVAESQSARDKGQSMAFASLFFSGIFAYALWVTRKEMGRTFLVCADCGEQTTYAESRSAARESQTGALQ